MAQNGWNRSSAKEVETPKKQRGIARGAIAGIVVVVLASAVAWFVLFSGKDEPKPEPKAEKKGQIKEVTPAKAATNVEEKVDKNSLEWRKKHDPRYFIPEGSYRAANGRLYTPNGRRILEDLPARTIYADKGRKKIFQHSAEKDIARLLSIEPGKFFIGNGNYGPRFIESFKKSLTEPTLVTQDDTDEEKALKRQVNEVKADLKARMDAGEDIGQVMKEAEQELRDLAAYKNNMIKELNQIRMGQDVSEQDFQDYIDAANKMMKERGLKELKFPAIHESQLKMLRERYRARQAEKEQKAAETAQKAQGEQK